MYYRGQNFTKDDEFYTPKSAWEEIKSIIPKHTLIWEAFYGDGKSSSYLKNMGFNVISKNEDFFRHDRGDIIVSNPPFSIKRQVLERCKMLDKPFIMIMPSGMLQTKWFREMWQDENIQIIVPNKRIIFEKDFDGKRVPQPNRAVDVYYYCWKINLKKDWQYASQLVKPKTKKTNVKINIKQEDNNYMVLRSGRIILK